APQPRRQAGGGHLRRGRVASLPEGARETDGSALPEPAPGRARSLRLRRTPSALRRRMTPLAGRAPARAWRTGPARRVPTARPRTRARSLRLRVRLSLFVAE